MSKPLPAICEDCEWYGHETDYHSSDGLKEACKARDGDDLPEGCPDRNGTPERND
jgi:hypothetical protein